MIAIVQRVSSGGVFIKEENYRREIGNGIVILLGVKERDGFEEMKFVADKCANLRIFGDENGKMNLSLKDVNGEALVISQFTLYGDTRKGNRPSYADAAKPEEANELYQMFVERMKENIGAEKVKTGIFGAMMEVKIINDGPVTLIVKSKE
ncbi:MAG: D-tyrosyl-tRNA(Tyr) deacylase [Chlorobi bacterium]|nr:D-tyrosyl-tRNA(Tyr) deacylase [Chlorobiota bacterium]